MISTTFAPACAPCTTVTSEPLTPAPAARQPAASPLAATKPLCDIVLPVHNGLTYAREAIDSLLAGTDAASYRLILVDDASDAHTAAYLAQVAVAHPASHPASQPAARPAAKSQAQPDAQLTATHPQVQLITLAENQGFVQACLQGYAASSAAYICLLNSDVVVPPGWLGRLIHCAEQDPRIGAVNPVTNRAAHLEVPMAPGANYLGMDRLLNQQPPSCRDVVTGVGFCLLLRRAALEQIGFFDPLFGHGYCEDSDLCMRLTTNGWRSVIATNVYCYHRGSASFGPERDARYLANRRRFDQRWSREYRRQFAAFRKADPLRALRQQHRPASRWDPKPVIWSTARQLHAALQQRQPVTAARAAARGLLQLANARQPIPDRAHISAVTRPERLRVTYLLPSLLVAGGVLSVIQLVNALIRRGAEVRLLSLFRDPLIQDWTRLYTEPVICRSAAELIAACPPTDVLVATHWSTVDWAAAIRRDGRADTLVGFLQDYEPWFYPEQDSAARQRVRASYAQLDACIVKSDWLAGMLAADGHPCHKIRLGMDLDSFYPRKPLELQPDQPEPPRILAMARPGTPYRGFNTLIATCQRIRAARPEVRIHLFGDRNLRRHKLPFPFQDEGLVTNQQQLARLYNAADLFIDGSDFQGFGRCALEAMACGTACVLTNAGGVREYAVHDLNALLVPPREPEALADAALALLDQPQRRQRLVAAGLNTAQDYDLQREADQTLAFFRRWQSS